MLIYAGIYTCNAFIVSTILISECFDSRHFGVRTFHPRTIRSLIVEMSVMSKDVWVIPAQINQFKPSGYQVIVTSATKVGGYHRPFRYSVRFKILYRVI